MPSRTRSSVMREWKSIAIGLRILRAGGGSGIAAEVNVKVFDLAGHIAGETRFNAAACGPACPQLPADEIIAGRNGHCPMASKPVPQDGAGVLDLSIGQATGDIGHALGVMAGPQAAAHRAEPIQIVLMDHGHRCFERRWPDCRSSPGTRRRLPCAGARTACRSRCPQATCPIAS